MAIHSRLERSVFNEDCKTIVKEDLTRIVAEPDQNTEIADICLIGLGYVGLPLAVAFAEKFKVIGYDINSSRIKELEDGVDRTLEIESKILASLKNNLNFTTNIDDIKECKIYIITVPTPINNFNEPDLEPLIRTSKTVGRILKKDDIVIFESTVYPGVTEEVCVPELEKSSDLKFNKDFYCGYSPERINPGDKERKITNILKITSGSTPETAKVVDELYKSIIKAGTYLAPNIKVAEAAKVIENIQRDVNIALINELAMIFDLMNINTNDAIEAASTKWNFIKLKPGLVGGHCIAVDPYYLSHKAQELGYFPKLILGAREINNGMSKIITDKTIKLMLSSNKKLNGSKVLILGISFKDNCPDTRNSKIFNIIKELKEFKCNVDIHDYLVNKNNPGLKNISLLNEMPLGSKNYDAIIVALGHEKYKELTMKDYESMSTDKPIIIDIKGIVENPTWRL